MVRFYIVSRLPSHITSACFARVIRIGAEYCWIEIICGTYRWLSLKIIRKSCALLWEQRWAASSTIHNLCPSFVTHILLNMVYSQSSILREQNIGLRLRWKIAALRWVNWALIICQIHTTVWIIILRIIRLNCGHLIDSSHRRIVVVHFNCRRLFMAW